MSEAIVTRELSTNVDTAVVRIVCICCPPCNGTCACIHMSVHMCLRSRVCACVRAFFHGLMHHPVMQEE